MYTNEIKNINTPFGKTNNFAFPTSLVDIRKQCMTGSDIPTFKLNT